MNSTGSIPADGTIALWPITCSNSSPKRSIDLTKAIELQPNLPKYYLQRADALSRLDRLEAAAKDQEYAASLVQLAEINRLIKRSPADAALWVRRGQAFLRADRLDEAIADFERALHLDPNSVAALTGRAAIHLRRRQHRGSR